MISSIGSDSADELLELELEETLLGEEIDEGVEDDGLLVLSTGVLGVVGLQPTRIRLKRAGRVRNLFFIFCFSLYLRL